ncbi:unnamed protein product [Parascedosporium putredinis]|uniref:Uncharacterized protein n=1 Tax=Parascedosporium putredinis TaxID=1442378 RepID=A0A9P1HBT7_9PEZI|nr:unnamed protein product [Parascedosporium putredinis]CAI8004053.1 unnamed protein product [Parascedosporium putredinis]
MQQNSVLSDASPASPIADKARACIRLFQRLSLSIARSHGAVHGITMGQVMAYRMQFEIWTTSSGALQSVPATCFLDSRLSKDPKVSAMFIMVLDHVIEALEDVLAMASDGRKNRAGKSFLRIVMEAVFKPTSDIQKSFQSIPEFIKRLFKLSLLITQFPMAA